MQSLITRFLVVIVCMRIRTLRERKCEGGATSGEKSGD